MSDPISAIVGSIASKNAASSAKRAASAASAVQDEKLQEAKDIAGTQYGVAKGYQQPFYDQGLAGQNALTYGLGLGGTAPGAESNVTAGSLTRPFSMADYQQDPGYQFRLAEGQKALDRNAAAKRMYFSGAATKGLERYNQDQASNEYSNAYNRYNQNQQNIYNRLGSLASTGQAAGNNLSNMATDYGNTIGNYDVGQGQNTANGIMAVNQAKQAGTMANAGIVSGVANLAQSAFGGGSGYNLFGSGTNYNPANIQYGSAANNLPWQV